MDTLNQTLIDIARAPLDYVVAPEGYRYKANEAHDNRHPKNQEFRRRIQSLRIAEYELEQSGKSDAAKGVRRVIDDLVSDHRYQVGFRSI